MNSRHSIVNGVLVIIACTAGVRAQDEGPKRDVFFRTESFGPGAPPPPGAMGNTFRYIGPEAMIPGKVVKSAPYSATAITETVQYLADGNRITDKITSFMARDSEGRTRREQSLPAIGPWASESAAPKMVTINDPVAGATYMLDENTKTARKLPAVQAQKLGYERMVIKSQGAAATADGPVMLIGGAAITGYKPDSAAEPKQEKLGQSTIEGIMAEGTRATTVLAAGTVGNERPITVTDERWYSPDLQLTVLSKHSDPRTGETTFRLTNVSRSEPTPSLFEVPADYNVVDSKDPVQIKIEKR